MAVRVGFAAVCSRGSYRPQYGRGINTNLTSIVARGVRFTTYIHEPFTILSGTQNLEGRHQRTDFNLGGFFFINQKAVTRENKPLFTPSSAAAAVVIRRSVKGASGGTLGVNSFFFFGRVHSASPPRALLLLLLPPSDPSKLLLVGLVHPCW